MVAFLLVLGVHGICNVSNDGLMACKPAIQNDNPVDQPSKTCCKALKYANVTCLCEYKDSYMLRTLDINSTRAMELPYMCKTATAPIDCTSARHG
ncbi:putative lipid-transfer protein DIR1 [Carex littledalei]|uniref:Putative lipid-transfer protein DIR1 n=1 Tax=Carex littledalei TaxID=544730 RepID=A0A833RKM4_9POAL|nr:putative lipid-transfer protein DIR1 [Carex littledalei]